MLVPFAVRPLCGRYEEADLSMFQLAEELIATALVRAEAGYSYGKPEACDMWQGISKESADDGNNSVHSSPVLAAQIVVPMEASEGPSHEQVGLCRRARVPVRWSSPDMQVEQLWSHSKEMEARVKQLEVPPSTARLLRPRDCHLSCCRALRMQEQVLQMTAMLEVAFTVCLSVCFSVTVSMRLSGSDCSSTASVVLCRSRCVCSGHAITCRTRSKVCTICGGVLLYSIDTGTPAEPDASPQQASLTACAARHGSQRSTLCHRGCVALLA